MNDKIIGFKFSVVGGYGFENNRTTYVINHDESHITKQSKNHELGKVIINETKIDQSIGDYLLKYVNEQNLSDVIKEEIKTEMMWIDAGGFELELTYRRYTEVYDLSGLRPDSLEKLETYIEKIFE